MPKERIHFEGKIYKRGLPNCVIRIELEDLIGWSDEKETNLYERTTAIIGGKPIFIERLVGSDLWYEVINP